MSAVPSQPSQPQSGGTVIRLVPITGDAGPDSRAVYSVPEVAYMLSLSLGSTYNMVRKGQIPAKKMGARWVIPKRRFHVWLDELPEAGPDDIDPKDGI
jgi:excisionase family DNA binding protein